MSDQLRVVAALEGAAERGSPVALVSVVGTDGPVYRRCGARMVVREDGSSVGMVSAGCLEADLALRARRALGDGMPTFVTYDGRASEELDWGEGCGGVLDLLIEPLSAERASRIAALLRAALEAESPSTIATVLTADGDGAPWPGARLVLRGGVPCAEDGEWGDGRLHAVAVAALQRPTASGGCGIAVRDVLSSGTCSARLCVETVEPVVRLVICGSGRDVEPVCSLALTLGWDVTVVDHRPLAVARPERFAGARVIECADASRVAEQLVVTPRTAAVVMSHHLARDTAYLGSLLAESVGHIGVLGPRARTARMLAELAASGSAVLDRAGDVVRGPVGLDIGGEGAEAIALSIVAEVQAVMHGRLAGGVRRAATRAEARARIPSLAIEPERSGVVRPA